MPPQIIGLRGEQANKSFSLGDAPITFGRNPDNTVVLASGRASRRHAEIRRAGDVYVLADLGSSNGTLVNGQRLTAPHQLRHGDTFEIGDDLFRFDAYIEILGKEEGFQHGDAAEVQIAGQPGLMFKSSYTHKDGQARAGVAIAAPSPASGLSYAIAAQALATDFDSQTDIFDTILASLTIE